MLEVAGLSVAYGQHRALENVSIRVAPGEIVVILGANGAGKSTLLRTIAGVCEGTANGTIEMDGSSLMAQAPHRIVEAGIALVPEGRGIFADLTVRENLLLGAYADRGRVDQQLNLDRVMELFPKLGERHNQVVRTMSGGEQQMVAIGRGMMSSPAILMLDEPSLGLSPLLCRELFQRLAEVQKSGLGILLVEQNAKQSLAIADRGYLLENGQIMGADTALNLARDPNVQKAYLGVSGAVAPLEAPPEAAQEARSIDPPLASASPGKIVPPLAAPGSSGADHARFTMSEVGRHATARRSSTDDLIGERIDDLVQRAAGGQAGAAGKASVPSAADRKSEIPGPARIVGAANPDPRVRTAAPRSPTNGAGTGDRLREVLAEIERAAANARLSTTETPAPPPSATYQSNGSATTRRRLDEPERFDDLPTIEVWKREPKVEVYRREVSGDGKSKLVKR